MTDQPIDSSPVPWLRTRGAEVRRYRSGRGVIVVAVVVLALVVGGGLLAASLIKSPAQQAAQTASPPPDTLTAAVESRVLTDTVVVRGTVTATGSVAVTAPTTSGDVVRAVVTLAPPPVGSRVRAGAVLTAVSGRPVVALPGKIPMYRDLRPGLAGPDVAEFQRALADLGIPASGDPSGVYGPSTKSAVDRFYERIGYPPLPAVADGAAQVDAARAAVRQTQWDLDDAKHGRDRQRARAALATAQRTLDTAVAADGPMVAVGEIQFVRQLPARVATVRVRLGGQVGDGPLLTLSTGGLTVTTGLQDHQRDLVRTGMSATITDDATGHTYPAVVRSVADTATDPQQAADGTGGSPDVTGYRTVVTPTAALPASLGGADVRVTIVAASSGAKVLAVPSSAIFAGADYQTAVVVVAPDGTRRTVPVAVGSAGSGYVQVTPAAGKTLSPGQQVAVGVSSGVGSP